MGDEFERGIFARIGFCGEAKQFVIFGDIFSRDGFPQANVVNATVDSVADCGDIMTSDAMTVIPAHTVGTFKVGGLIGCGD